MKKKRSTNLRSALPALGLLALAALLAQCGVSPLGAPTPAETLPTRRATAPPSGTVAYAPTETATPSPRGTPSPLPTPFVLQVTGVNEVVLPAEEFMLEGLYGDLAVGITPGENNQVWLVDLSTGQWRRLDRSPDATYRVLPHISERWVVWEEDFDTPRGGYGVRLVAYDLKRDHEFQVPITRTAHVLEIALSGDIVVWGGVIDYYGSASDIFARNLATGQTWTVAAGPRDQWAPLVSGQWVVYLDKEERAYSADLRAHHLPTGEDFLIGQVPNPPDSSAGKYHVIAGTRVVWIKYQPDPVSQLHVFDSPVGCICERWQTGNRDPARLLVSI